ncbi:MAG: helix-turn-helix transcriptional regulator [Bacteroidia bacterium]|nr:helix-turn-helix transcriptional regulator [Bacteroidia bacterium]
MSLLSKFVDSLHVNLSGASFREGILPFSVNNHIQNSNIIVHLNEGNIFMGKERIPIEKDGFCFLPAGKPITLEYGQKPHYELGDSGFTNEEEISKFLRFVSPGEDHASLNEAYTFVALDISLFNAIPFFEVLDLPPFLIPPDAEFAFLVKHIAREFHNEKLGRNMIIRNYMEEIVIHLCRYLHSQPEYKNYIDRLEFLSDRRLVDIMKYIQTNLEKDLSNKIIANVAYVSEDYVGQFFKSLTKKNLQDYIEHQRLDKALYYLRTEPDNIQEIAHRVGFKDPAYFSRRFKMKFGYNANSIRHQSSPLV